MEMETERYTCLQRSQVRKEIFTRNPFSATEMPNLDNLSRKRETEDEEEKHEKKRV